jgi:hypothetical protein
VSKKLQAREDYETIKILNYENMVVFPKSSIWEINSNRPEGTPK